MIYINMPSQSQKQQPKSIFKNPERNDKNKIKIKKRVRFSEENKIKHLILVFLIILLITSAILYFSFKDKINREEYKIYIRQILDYISLSIQKIKLLIYNKQKE